MLHNCGQSIEVLSIPYFPYAREDKIVDMFSCRTLEVCTSLINSVGAERVDIVDPHSFVAPALINNVNVIPQWAAFKPILDQMKDYYIVSPDAGSIKKCYELADQVKSRGVIQCSKHRNLNTGKVTDIHVHATENQLNDMKFNECSYYVVDDICGGGKPFFELGIELRKIIKHNKLGLMVTHGFFTSGLDALPVYDEIYTRKGRVK